MRCSAAVAAVGSATRTFATPTHSCSMESGRACTIRAMSGGSARSGFDAAGQPVSLLDAVTYLDSAAVGAAGGGASQEMAEPPLDGGAAGAMRDAFAADSELRASAGEAFALQMPGSRRPPEDRSGLG